MKVEVDQVWSCLLTHSSKRVEFKITRIEGGAEPRAYGDSTATGKEVSFTVRALANGSRAARLVRHADGHVPYKAPVEQVVESTATASDHRYEKAPKGILTAPPRMQEAFAMREQQMSIAQIAKHFGVKPSTVSGWLQRVHERIADERVRQQLSGRSA